MNILYISHRLLETTYAGMMLYYPRLRLKTVQQQYSARNTGILLIKLGMDLGSLFEDKIPDNSNRRIHTKS